MHNLQFILYVLNKQHEQQSLEKKEAVVYTFTTTKSPFLLMQFSGQNHPAIQSQMKSLTFEVHKIILIQLSELEHHAEILSLLVRLRDEKAQFTLTTQNSLKLITHRPLSRPTPHTRMLTIG